MIYLLSGYAVSVSYSDACMWRAEQNALPVASNADMSSLVFPPRTPPRAGGRRCRGLVTVRRLGCFSIQYPGPCDVRGETVRRNGAAENTELREMNNDLRHNTKGFAIRQRFAEMGVFSSVVNC